MIVPAFFRILFFVKVLSVSANETLPEIPSETSFQNINNSSLYIDEDQPHINLTISLLPIEEVSNNELMRLEDSGFPNTIFPQTNKIEATGETTIDQSHEPTATGETRIDKIQPETTEKLLFSGEKLGNEILLKNDSISKEKTRAHLTTDRTTTDNINEDQDWNGHMIEDYILLGFLEGLGQKYCSSPALLSDFYRREIPKFYFEKRTKTCLPFLFGSQTDSEYTTVKSCYSKCYPQWKNSLNYTDYVPRIYDLENERVLSFNGNAYVRYDIKIEKLLQISFTMRTFQSEASVFSLIRIPEFYSGDSIHIDGKLQDGKFVINIYNGETKADYTLDYKGNWLKGAWHFYLLQFNEKTKEIILQLDDQSKFFQGKDFFKMNVWTESERLYHLWVGGIPVTEMKGENAKFQQFPLAACLKLFKIITSRKNFFPSYDVEITGAPLSQNIYSDIKCMNRCSHNISNCSPNSLCVEKFDDIVCKLFKQNLKPPGIHRSILTLSGEEYIGYGLNYIHRKRDETTSWLSITFKTNQANSLVLSSKKNHNGKELQLFRIALTNKGSLTMEVNGNKLPILSNLELYNLTDNNYHTLSILKQYHQLLISLDDHSVPLQLEDPFNLSTLFGDQLLIGGQPLDDQAFRSSNFFVGCFKEIFILDDDVIQSLNEGSNNVEYFGPFVKNLPIANFCQVEEEPSLSFTSDNETLSIGEDNLNSNDGKINLNFNFKLKENTNLSMLLTGIVNVNGTEEVWQVFIDEESIVFLILSSSIRLTLPDVVSIDRWIKMSVLANDETISLTCDHKNDKVYLGDQKVYFNSLFYFGRGILNYPGFVGCVREIQKDGRKVDVRSYLGTSSVTDGVTMDRCEIMTACEKKICPTESQCHIEDNQPVCQCPQQDPFCFFDKYSRSCDHYRILGFNYSGTYLVNDLKNEKQKKRIYCDMGSDTKQNATVIVHNMPDGYVVRAKSLTNPYKINVTYRDFSEAELKKLVVKSSKCSQSIKFSCQKAALMLHKNTFISSPWIEDSVPFGTNDLTTCACSDNNESCAGINSHCNCDVMDGYPKEDRAVITTKEYLPITSLKFWPTKTLSKDFTTEISLGNLECWNEVQSDEAFLVSKSSFIEVPNWRKGLFSFKFKTTSSNGNIWCQNTSETKFQLNLLSEYELGLFIEINNKSIIISRTIYTDKAFNSGDWNFISIEVIFNHVKLNVNQEDYLLVLPVDLHQGDVDGISKIGSCHLPLRLETTDENSEEKGFVGCISNLMVNDEVIDLGILALVSGHDVNDRCMSSCNNIHCENGAKCIEDWPHSFCICSNPYAQSGVHCEQDINEDSITFSTSDGELLQLTGGIVDNNTNPLLAEYITFNFLTREEKAMLFMAQDHVQNIIQVYLESPRRIAMLYNYDKDFRQLHIDVNVDLNKGQSVQVVIERKANTVLKVFTNGREFFQEDSVGLLLIDEDAYQQFPYEVNFPLAIQYQHSFTLPGSFLLIFIGGVKSAGITTELPGLIGCFRGLKINNKQLSLQDEYLWNYGGDVMKGCSSKCENENPCENDGMCLPDFKEYPTYVCLCDGTSFEGEHCNQEFSYTLNGSQWIESKYRMMNFTESLRSVAFAFVMAEEIYENQLLFYIQIEDRMDTPTTLAVISRYSVDLGREILIKIEGYQTKAITVPYSGSTSSRNYLKIILEEKNVNVKLNQRIISAELDERIEWEFYSPQESIDLFIGGMPKNYNVTLASFKGCISNVLIDTSSASLNVFENKDLYQEIGIPNFGKCGAGHPEKPSYKIKPWAYPEPEKIILADKSVDEETSTSYSTIQPNVTSTTNSTESTDDPEEWKPVTWPWILFGVLLGLSATALIVTAMEHHIKKQKERQISDSTLMGIPATRGPPPPRPRQNEEIITMLEREPSVIRPQQQARDNTEESKPLLDPRSHQNQSSPQNEALSTSSQNLIQSGGRHTPPPPYTEEPSKTQIPQNSSNSPLRHIDSSSSDGSDEKLNTNQIASTSLEYNDISELSKEPPEKVDLKTYHLKRKASNPPDLPPKQRNYQ